MDRKIRVAAVSYTNTKPMIWGFEQGMLKDRIELITDYPARIADMLVNDACDIGLVPVATIPRLSKYQLISDYCIGTEGEVGSVCLFSDVPLAEIGTILLDYQSRSSVALLRILLRDRWQINPELQETSGDYEHRIAGTTAGLVIGDRAFAQRKKSKYIFDLGLAWRELTGLPFIFAAWISNKDLSADFLNDFNAAVGAGFAHLPEITSSNYSPYYDLNKYYTENISFSLTNDKRRGLTEFLRRMAI